MKANTTEQYHILEWLVNGFYLYGIRIEWLSRNSAKIIDKNNDEFFVYYDSEERKVKVR